MKKKVFITIAAMFLGGPCTMAQIEGDEITVTTTDGEADVIEVPEGMLLEIDSLLNLYNSKTYLQDNDCHYSDNNPDFPVETYIERLQRIPSVMEMPYNDVVRKFIDRYAVRLRASVSYMLGAANFYMPLFEEALEMYNLPLELKYLPVIESALSPTATSRVGAAGLWQFMLATGKQYGLEVNSLVDERRDPIKSTYAAARYLRDLYKIYDDWNLVIAAYNYGPQNINKAIHRAGGVKDYWAIYKYLPRETQGYVPAFIAANYIMTYYCEHNICPMRTQIPAKSDTIVVNRDVHFKQIAAVTGIRIEELRSLNPQYRRDIVNGSTQPSVIRLPQTYVNTFLDREDSIYNYEAATLLTKRAVVEVTAEDVKQEVVARSQTVAPRTSQASRGRTKAATQSRSRKGGKTASKGKSQSVTVKSGQTLSQIAKKNNTTVDKLKRLNGIKGNTIQAGKKIKVK
ncbi:MAG: transglycosylase SLT domain-containing protein [Prevotella sp.]|nr:transglycosylase SLT domain-containing protein [Prevotella sp.]